MTNRDARDFAIIGLGQIGGNLARLALERRYRVFGVEKDEVPRSLIDAGVVPVDDPAGLVEALAPPRRVLLYLPPGSTVDFILNELAAKFDRGDVIVDGGNAYWGDSIRRHARLKSQGIAFVDAGTSGGLPGARHGACFMVGGDRDAVAAVEPIFRDLSVHGGYVHAGGPGAGHFVKLVHNGIEFGMMQAIAEGVDLLEHYRETLPVSEILRCWRNGSVIRSWLVELLEEAYRGQGGDRQVPPYVEDTGEVNWLVDDALHMEVPVPVIAQSVMQLLASRDSDQHWARAIAMMRHGFGNHPFGRDEGIARERRESRVGGYPREP